MKYPSQNKGHDKMDLLSVVLFVLAIAPVTTINLLEDSHSNADGSCEDFRCDGKRLPIAEVIISDRVFTWKNCGEVVPVDEVNKEIPVVKFSQDNETMYLVAMLDPDTPSFHNPLCRHWVHYIFGNVKGKYLAYGKIRGGNIYGEYNPPNPQPGQGIHRFYFFVFEQKEKLVDGIHITNRCGFNVDGFMRDFNLKPRCYYYWSWKKCDKAFKSDMKKAYRKQRGWWKTRKCRSTAGLYYLAVRTFGKHIIRFPRVPGARIGVLTNMEVLTEKSVAKEGLKNEDMHQKGNNDS